ncbi:hypothetical protein N1851_014073 [Merluccius polli]|uniref:Uncharacterized protein n=1 Tax=Merluccius polli TaxID=89951 RepID=A0AA47MTW0_MERPO|nr:hypothetical protein N1851_014073 [Merluccius polli]
MTAVDKSGLPGKFKAWIYQHGVLPRILWPLLVSLNEEFMVTRAREVLQHRESSDPKVSQAGIVRAREAVEQAESCLRHSMLVGPVASGRAGLGSVPTTRYDKALGKDRRRLVQE